MPALCRMQMHWRLLSAALPTMPSVFDEPRPVDDLQDVLTELIITDLNIVERRLERLAKTNKITRRFRRT